MPSPDEKAPPGMTCADIEQLGNGLLANMGDQNLQGHGTMKDLLAKKCGGTSADSIDTNPNVAWRAYRTAMAIKNRDAGGGQAQSPADRIDGRIDGFEGDNAVHGTDSGYMQDYLLHDEVPPPAKNLGAPPAPGTTLGQQLAIDGNTTDLPAPDEKAPPGLTAGDIGNLDNGLLGSLGNQAVMKNGKSMGELRDVLARWAGGENANSLATNPDVAWRAYRALVAVKNETANDGTEKPSYLRHSGNIGGYASGAENAQAPHGSEAGSLQDLLAYGRVPHALESDPNDQTDEFGQTCSNAQVAGKEFKRFGLKILEGIGMGVMALIPGADALDGFMGGVMAATDAATDAASDTVVAASDAASGVGDAVSEGSSFTSTTLRNIATQITNKTGLNVSDEDVEQMLKSVAKEIAKQGLKVGKNQLEDYVKQAIENQMNNAPPSDQPRPMTFA